MFQPSVNPKWGNSVTANVMFVLRGCLTLISQEAAVNTVGWPLHS